MKKWDKTNRKYAKLCWLSNKIFTLNIIVLPKLFQWKTESEKFSPNFLCFAKVQLCLSLIPLYSKNIECYDNNNLFHKYILCLEQILFMTLNFISIRILELNPWVNNILNYSISLHRALLLKEILYIPKNVNDHLTILDTVNILKTNRLY